MNQTPKRSKEPIVWGLFGAGGTVGAIFTPVMVLLVGIILPFASLPTVSKILTLAPTILGKLFLMLVIILPIWCSLHRLHLTSHDLKMHIPASKLIFYGLATVLSIIALCGIIML